MTAAFETGLWDTDFETDTGLLEGRIGVLYSVYPESDTSDCSDNSDKCVLLAIPNQFKNTEIPYH